MKNIKQIVLVIDGGGRGAALVHAYLKSRLVKKVLAVPGNDLMKVQTTKPVETFPDIGTTNIQEILNICEAQKVTLVDVAQDNAVEAGLVDALLEKNIAVVGPTKLAGQIEWDKAWAREFGERHHLPQPAFKICHSQKEGFEYLKTQTDQPWFIKASGLAEGKGALPAANNAEAVKMIKEMTRFGKSGQTFLIEKWLQSDAAEPAEEFSLFVVSDGNQYQILGTAQDHKRVNNFDEGENTGGMGCVSSPLVLTPALIKNIDSKIIKPTIKGLAQEGRAYTGILYLGGIIIKQQGRLQPYVIEFNARWGDPEAQVLLPGITTDLFKIGRAIIDGTIGKLKIRRDDKSRGCGSGNFQGLSC